jgi:transcriptional regulator with XRE-family HTH domain
MKPNLDDEVLALLQARKGDWQRVASDAQVSYSWLSKFANGHIGNPGYGTLIRLRACLQDAPKTAA